MADREGSAFGQHPHHTTGDVHVQREQATQEEADLGLYKQNQYKGNVGEQEVWVEDALADADKKQYGGDFDDNLSEDAANDYDKDGNAAELPRRPQGCWSRFSTRMALIVGAIIPAGGILASAMNIAGATIGGGILGLPGGANRTGLVLAYIYVALMLLFNIMSMRMLGMTAEKTGIRSFEAMARYLFPQGHYAFSYWMAFVRWFNSMGCCIAYVISVGNSFKPIFEGALEKYPDNRAYKYFSTANGLKVMTVIVFFVIMVPMIIPRHVDTLRHVAFVAVILMMYFCVIVVVHSCMNGLPIHRHNIELSNHFGRGDESGKIYLFRTGNPCMEALGTFVFAFVCQVNAVEVYWDMAKHVRTPNGFTAASALALTICAVIYTFVFTFGYFDFGAETLGSKSILLMYTPMKDPEVMLAYVGVLVKLCVAFGLQFMAARNAAYYAIGFTQRYANKKGKEMSLGKKNKNKKKSDEANEPVSNSHSVSHDDEVPAKVATKVQVGQEIQRPLEEGAQPAPAAGGLSMDLSYVDNIPIQWHLLTVTILAAICLILGLFIPNINIVFDFVGSICCSFLEFITPAMFIIYSGGFTIKRIGLYMWVITYLSLVIGIIALVFGTGATIYGLAGGE